LNIKEETGKFPLRNNWIVANGYLCSYSNINKLFGSYTNFKNYCVEEISKEKIKEFALKVKKETGKFPKFKEWIMRNGYPTGYSGMNRLFGSYNNFRDYCDELHIIRTEKISINWIKSNCIVEDNKCWNWNRSLSTHGYGLLSDKRKTWLVHRLVYTLQNGEILEGLLVRHKCDNRKCCNPEHLELGTNQDNALDVLERKKDLKRYTNSKLIIQSIKYKTIKEKLNFYLNNIDKDDNDCWISNLLKATSIGYYQIQFNKKIYRLHRLVLAQKLNKDYSEIDTARHICHNKNCINPEHLIEGSRQNNSLDSRNYSKVTKLTEEKVIDIKRDIKLQNFTIRGNKIKFDRKWAAKFNVSKGCIENIRLNNTWKDINVL